MRAVSRLFVLLVLLSLLVHAQEVIYNDGFENHDPVINTMPPTSGLLGELYQYDVDASDLDGDPLLYLLTVAPAGMSIDAVSGVISWTMYSEGAFPVEVDVSDGQGGAAHQAWFVDVADVDTDNDGLSDSMEAAYGTDPMDSDSDDDGLDDGAEVFVHGTDPLVTDSDRDGLDDGAEVNQHATDPALVDTDGDGYGDGMEVYAGTDPLDENDFPEGPPDPEAVAPPADPGSTTTVYSSTGFIWNGSPPIQTGVAEGTIIEQRAAALRGRVVDRDGMPRAGVIVSISEHPEYGQTLSRVDGYFDLVVNGGSYLVVNFEAPGLLGSQRQVQVPWQGFVEVPEVAMIPLDPVMTTVDFDAPGMKLAQGSEQVDQDGTRQATLLVPDGVAAEVEMPDGSTQPASSLDIRITEYTVGENGPLTMPAALPPASAYTYAFELSADEAIAAGASRVNFSEPLVQYVENFLNFPVGGPAPTGYYDPDRMAWVPSANGRIIRILDVVAGLAEVDSTGDEVADNGVSIGMTDAERQQLAGLYTIGQSLWRVLIPHFSAWDVNWGVSPPDDARAPNVPSPRVGSHEEVGLCLLGGSIIEAQNQTLRETAIVGGTPYTLNYSSERTPARLDLRRLNVSLSGNSIPASAKRIDLKVDVAGQHHLLSFPTDPNQSTTFTWDGRDAFGREMQGIQKVGGSIGYVYDASYANPSGRFGYNGNGVAIEGAGTREELSLLQPFEDSMGTWDARGSGLGGWTLDVHHFYDPVSQTLYLGDGSKRGSDSLPRIIDTVAEGTCGPISDLAIGPDGSQYYAVASDDCTTVRRLTPNGVETIIAGGGKAGAPDYGDGGPATSARLLGPVHALEFGGSGSLYILESTVLRRVRPDGIIERVGGLYNTAGPPGCDVENSVALETRFCQTPSALAVAPDDTVYTVNGTVINGNVPLWYIYRIDTDGIGTRFAGAYFCNHFNNLGDTCGDGGPAKEAGFEQLEKTITVGPDGSVFVGDVCAIRRIGPDGIISRYAGIYGFQRCWNSPNQVVEGSLATEIRLGQARGLAVTPEGLVVAYNYGRVMQIDNNRRIVRLAGTGTPQSRFTQTGDKGPALAAVIGSPSGLALGPDNSIYIMSGGNTHRKIGKPQNSSLSIASEDGSELYVFNAAGRHLRTLHALTGVLLREFSYDAQGRLTRVVEKSGDVDVVTEIEHDAEGNPTRIIGPFGQITKLSVDRNGFLSNIESPAAEHLHIGSTSGGLITGLTDARGKHSTYGYDGDGRLIAQSDTAAHTQSLVFTPQGTGYEVTRTTGLGRSSTYRHDTLDDKSQRQIVVAPDGSESTRVRKVDAGSETSSLANGSQSSWSFTPDPRFGMQSPVVKSSNVTMPGGPSYSASLSRSVELGDPTDLLSVTSASYSRSENGQVGNDIYTAANRTLVSTSPAGRSSTASFDSKGRMVQHQIADLYPTFISYDQLGRPESVDLGEGPDTRTLSFGYDSRGYLRSLTDPLGRTVQFNRDAVGRVDGKLLPGGVEITAELGAAGDIASLTPPGRPAHHFSYDLNGNLAAYDPPTVPGGGSSEYSYNPDKQLAQITRPGGESIDFSYDTSGRIELIELQDGGGPQASYTLSYLTADQLQSVVGPGSQSLSFQYQGPLIAGETWSGPVTGNVVRTFDNHFRLASESVNGGSAISYQYDADDLLVGVGELSVTRNPDTGLPESADIGLVTTAWAHNRFGETTAYSVSADGSDLFAVEYQYDAIGRIAQRTETVQGVVHVYDYEFDLRGQLTEVRKDSQVVESYQYDSNGNRTGATVSGASRTGVFDDQDRLLSLGSMDYVWSPSGRLLSRTTADEQTTEFEYDVIGNLLGVAVPDGTQVDYGTDGFDRRVERRIDGAVVQRFLWSNYRLVAELDGTDALVSRFVYSSGLVPAYMIREGTTYRIISDHNGSVRLVVDTASGDIVQQIDYDSFGNVVLDTNPGFQPFAFAGGLYDPLTGLVRFGLRDYDADSGRWTAKDPIGFDGGDANLYRYVNNDPVNFADPSGLSGWDTLSGLLHGLGGLAQPGYYVQRLAEDITGMIYDLTFGAVLGWEPVDPAVLHHTSNLMYPPFPHSDELDYEAGDHIAQCVSLVVGGVGAASTKVVGAVRGLKAARATKQAASAAKQAASSAKRAKEYKDSMRAFQGHANSRAASVSSRLEAQEAATRAARQARADAALRNGNMHDHGMASNVNNGPRFGGGF